MGKDDKTDYPFTEALHKFLIEINGLSDSLPIIMKSLYDARHKTNQNIDKFVQDNKGVIKEIENNKHRKVFIYGVKAENVYGFETLLRQNTNFIAASSITPRGFLVTIVSQFDAFMGRLIKAMYYTKPDMLNSSAKSFTFANLIELGSMEAARDYILEKEVESVLRESHAEHFEWLEKKLEITLRNRDLAIWSDFIELTERRNLFVHTDGEVSSQYISVCEKNGVSIEKDCIVGKKLGVTQEYFQRACEILFELATKLTHTVWRKLNISELSEADKSLNAVCYDLLKEEKYELAKKILSFALAQKKHNSQMDKLIFTINIAIAYKWGGEAEKAVKIVTETDWSACDNSFKLASTVLLDNFDEAANIMRKIGVGEEVGKVEYKEWPVFKDFRQSTQFLEAYREVFGEFLEPIDITDEPTSLDQEESNFFSLDGTNQQSIVETSAV